jgi:hypothetical protein
MRKPLTQENQNG